MSTHPLLPREFYTGTDVVSIAKSLLGKKVISMAGNELTSGFIVETEAYRGPDDRGCHAYANRYTERTKTMFEPGGAAYVYICYGMHPMLNVVTGSEGEPHAVLIRAIVPLEGIDVMMQRRNMEKLNHQLTNGPGKLAVALGITKSMDGSIFHHDNSELQLAEGFSFDDESHIVSGLRVGMSIHVGPCAYRPWRFYIKGNKWVSRPLVVKYDF
ncbi:MAG: DNA-3-methyladenine glycosylase [Saprospiraceae bacterium]|nr:DNA-3-methyladenine glycosylase [Saprospiraceae bacterium]